MNRRDTTQLPLHQRPIEDLPGHWLLARLGKRVLRPGGKELTTRLLKDLQLGGKSVVELAPGLGKTASEILKNNVSSYNGVDEDPQAAAMSQKVVGSRGTVTVAGADNTGLDAGNADVVIGEAMLTMQGDKGKAAIISEAARVLKPGGRYGIHELCLEPDTLSDESKLEIRRALAKSIKVNARPLTTKEWSELLEAHGFRVEKVAHAPMALLKPKRNLQDEGPLRVAKIVFNLLRNPGARKRVMGMRTVFNKYQSNLAGISIVAVKES